MLRYCALFSSSSGNCTYIGTENSGVLIDAGVSAKRIRTALEQREINPRSIQAILITHEHSDHIAGLRVLCKNYGWPVLASKGTLDALAAGDKVTPDQRLYALERGKAVNIGDLQVTAFATPHDSRQCYGYRVESYEGKTAALATDIGYVTDEVVQGVTGCQLVHIESNHDVEMLQNGPYPYSLKQRILGQGGHLSNDACSEILPRLVATGTTRLILAHLSAQNNLPSLAKETAVSALTKRGYTVGRDCLLSVAEPEGLQQVTYF